MKKLLLPLAFLFIIIGYAQTETDSAEISSTKKSYLTLDLSTPVNIVAPRYRIGYIQTLSPKWKIGVDLGYGSEYTTFKTFINNDNSDYQLFEVRSEVYYVFNPTRRVSQYISGEVYVVLHSEEYTYDTFYDDDDLSIHYDKADMHREKYGVNLKYGVFVPFGNKVGMNAYIGAGPRIRNVEFDNLVNPNVYDDYIDDEFGFVNHHYVEEGTNFGFNFALGFKFFYVIQ